MKPTDKSLLPDYKKVDLRGWETFRVYEFPNGEKVRIDNPEFLIVSDNGHRIGVGRISHYIPYGWIHLWWENESDRDTNFYCEQPRETTEPTD